jgi:arylsulfatase A-like enzyme
MHIFKNLTLFIWLLSLNSYAQDQPNIILMMADDLGWGDTGYNGNSVILTPHLDQMAQDGIQFDRFYSASAVCSPTRASFLTGRNPHRTGVFTANRGILRPEETTIAELLQAKGYVTGHFGKWHLGTFTHTEVDSNRGRPGNIEEYNPASLHGNDVVFATEAKVPTYNPMVNTNGSSYGTSFWNENNEKVTENLNGDASRVVMDRVIPFIKEANNNGQPFLAIIWFHAPHLPAVAGPEYLELYQGRSNKMKHYAGCITAMDDQIGRLRTELKNINADQNTLISFCSDNGPEDNWPGITGGFKDRKRSLHEGGIRVPGLLVWPNEINQGFKTSEPAYTSDYLPTIADILDINLDPEIAIDGQSILPLIKGENFKRNNALNFAFGSQLALQDGQYKLYADEEQYELYDMFADSLETTNIINNYPERLENYKTIYKNWLINVKSSFDGDEYGTVSVDKLNQDWEAPIQDLTIPEPNTPLTDGGFENITSGTDLIQGNVTNPVGTWFSGTGNDGLDDAFYIETETVNSGNQALIMDNAAGAVKLYNNLTLSPNTTYTFSARIRNYEKSLDTNSAVTAGTRIVFQLLKNYNGDKAVIRNGYEATGELHNGGWKTASFMLSETEFRTVTFEFTTDDVTALTLQINVQPGFDVPVIIDDVSINEGSLSKTDFSKFNFSYAPNPVKNEINLAATKTISKVEFYNMIGQNVLSTKVNTLNTVINTNSLNKGLYIMNVTIEGQTQGFKILKQ